MFLTLVLSIPAVYMAYISEWQMQLQRRGKLSLQNLEDFSLSK